MPARVDWYIRRFEGDNLGKKLLKLAATSNLSASLNLIRRGSGAQGSKQVDELDIFLQEQEKSLSNVLKCCLICGETGMYFTPALCNRL